MSDAADDGNDGAAARNPIRLSILVCSLSSRAAHLSRLRARLDPQMTSQVELHVNVDDREKSTGRKRNELLVQARGEYLAFVDDDDLVTTDYVSRILTATESGPDCCGMEGIITFDGRNSQRFIHSLRYREWFESEGVYYRNPNHLSPVKREHALKARFPDTTIGEDRVYSSRLLPFLSTEVHIEGPIYHYLWTSQKA